jgi:hypothetical protein
MGFYLWIDRDLAWAQGTYEYRPMGAAVIAASGAFECREIAICFTHVGVIGRAQWGGCPRPRGAPWLRFRQRDGGVPRGPGGPPHQIAVVPIT